MTHDYIPARNDDPVFAAMNVLDGKVIGRNT